LKDVFLGIVVGIANLMPGISGGTIVFISGKYSDFVESLGSLFTFKFKRFGFLLRLVSGAIISILLLSKLIDILNESHPAEMGSFFSGLVMGGLMSIGTTLKISSGSLIFMTLGALSMIGLGNLESIDLPRNFGLVFGGILSGSAMVLPGISGSTMLVLMGMYDEIISAVSKIDVPILIVFGIGVVGGIAIVSIALERLIENWEGFVISFLFGLTLVGLIELLMKEVKLLYLMLGIVAATSFERLMKS